MARTKEERSTNLINGDLESEVMPAPFLSHLTFWAQPNSLVGRRGKRIASHVLLYPYPAARGLLASLLSPFTANMQGFLLKPPVPRIVDADGDSAEVAMYVFECFPRDRNENPVHIPPQ